MTTRLLRSLSLSSAAAAAAATVALASSAVPASAASGGGDQRCQSAHTSENCKDDQQGMKMQFGENPPPPPAPAEG